jgi:signal transduction histidine kinase
MKPIPPELRSFFADPQRLYQVFEYVISNAVKYTPDGGTITISIHLLDAPEDVDRFVEVRIADTGIGVSAEDLPRIFEKFYSKTDIAKHSSSRTKFKGGGSGLGLAVVKGIVEAHGGQVIIESPGHDEVKLPGTTARIFLPVRYDPPALTGQQRLGLTDSSDLSPRQFGTT